MTVCKFPFNRDNRGFSLLAVVTSGLLNASFHSVTGPRWSPDPYVIFEASIAAPIAIGKPKPMRKAPPQPGLGRQSQFAQIADRGPPP
jgi:hypothetical protein